MPPRPQTRQRRCCGLPLWGFIALVIILILLAALAVIIPIALIVLPRNNSVSPSAATAQCAQSKPCRNGGSNIVDANGQCACLCSNGFSGNTCTIASDSACTTVTAGGTSDATIGNAIPRLVDTAAANYSIPLDFQALIALFSSSNLSCGAENALVTLNGGAGLKKRFILMTGSAAGSVMITDESELENILIEPLQDVIDLALQPISTAAPTVPIPTQPPALPELPTIQLAIRQGSNLVISGDPGVAVTSNGILVASSAGPTSPTARFVSATVTSSSFPDPSALATDSSTPPTPSGSSTNGDPASGTDPSLGPGSMYFNATAMDFARVVTLFVLQISGKLDAAVTAQMRFQNWFDGVGGVQYEARNISLGGGFTANLVDTEVTISNGTVYGGGPGGFNGTAVAAPGAG